MKNDILETMITEEEIKEICIDLSRRITDDYKGKNPVLIGLLKGSVPFMADLSRLLDFKMTIDYLNASSYFSGTESSGVVSILSDLTNSIENRHVIIVEDIIDSGRTLKTILEYLEKKNPKSIEIATLLDKPDRRVVEIFVKYVGKIIPDKFAVGYGLDYNELYRNLPYVGVLKDKIYKI